MMEKIKTYPWDAAEDLQTDVDIDLYFEAILEECDRDAGLLNAALWDIVRAMGMRRLADETGMDWTRLFEIMKEKDNSDFDSLMEIVRALQPHLKDKATVEKKRESA